MNAISRRKQKFNDCSLSRLRGNASVAAALADEAIDHGQAKTSAAFGLAGFLDSCAICFNVFGLTVSPRPRWISNLVSGILISAKLIADEHSLVSTLVRLRAAEHAKIYSSGEHQVFHRILQGPLTEKERQTVLRLLQNEEEKLGAHHGIIERGRRQVDDGRRVWAAPGDI